MHPEGAEGPWTALQAGGRRYKSSAAHQLQNAKLPALIVGRGGAFMAVGWALDTTEKANLPLQKNKAQSSTALLPQE